MITVNRTNLNLLWGSPEKGSLLNVPQDTPLGSSHYTYSYSRVQQVKTRNGGQVYFQTPETAWLVYTNGLPECSSSELYAMEENQVLCIVPQVFMYNAEPTKAGYRASLCEINCPRSHSPVGGGRHHRLHRSWNFRNYGE